jgi:cell division septation protein DedD
MARGPSPRDEASRRDSGYNGNGGRSQSGGRIDRRSRGWDDENAPWLEEAEFEDGPTHTLVGRRTLWGILFGLAVLTLGVVVGIMLVSGRESGPIDVPGVGEEVPVLASPGPWKIEPTGPDVDGIEVEGQGDVRFGTGIGQETQAQIDLNALPEDPLPRPGFVDEEVMATAPAPVDETSQPTAAPPPVATPKPAPRPTDTVVPREAPKPAQPKIIYAPEPQARAPAQSGGGQVLQLGAFSSEARARSAFKSLSERFGYLGGLSPLIVPTEKDGKTLYRLRTAATNPMEARDICGRLRVAGEACSIVD